MAASRRFNPDKEIGDLSGKVIFITGGTAGLGAGSVEELAKHGPAHILFSGRNEKSATSLTQRVSAKAPNVKLTFVKCDISSLASVRECAASVKSTIDRLDVLMLNAGIMAAGPSLSTDGYEIQFATNQMGHAMLVKLLLPLLQQTVQTHGEARVVNMSSVAYENAPSKGIDIATLRTTQEHVGSMMLPAKWARYGQSKLAQILYTEQLAKHYPEITFIAVHPGYVMTGLFDGKSFITTLPVMIMSAGKKTPVEEGHFNQCWAASVEKKMLTNGEYYTPIGVQTRRKTRAANDRELGQRLWEWTQEELAAYE